MSDQPNKQAAPPRRNWRDIAQSGGHRRSSTNFARRRRWLQLGRWVGIVVLVLVTIGAVGYGVHEASKGLKPAPREADLLARITFRTDGVLNDRWFMHACTVRPGDPMNAIDVHAIKAVLEQQGQVREAQVTLRLPGELIVDVRERMPVLRARIAMEGKPRVFLIARDGTVYRGANYPLETVRALPFVDGVKFRRQGEGLAPLVGVETVAELLETARRDRPDIYAGWMVVDFGSFQDPQSPAALIRVVSRHVGEIWFSPGNFAPQVENLARVMLKAVSEPKPREILRVDLSLPGQAIVEYKGATGALAGGRR